MSTPPRFGAHRIAAVFDFDPIAMHEGPSLLLRLEVLEMYSSSSASTRYTARVLRREHLHILPSFGLRNGASPTPVDELVLVEDVQDFWSSISGASVDEVLTCVLVEIRDRFGVE